MRDSYFNIALFMIVLFVPRLAAQPSLGANENLDNNSLCSERRLLGELEGLSGVLEMSIQGNRLVVCSSGQGLTIADISDVRNPMVIGQYGVEGLDLCAIDGDFVYLVRDDQSILILDISDSTQPSVILEEVLTSNPSGMVAGNGYLYLYMGDLNRTVWIYDSQLFTQGALSDSFVNTVPTGLLAVELFFRDGYLALRSESGARMLDVRDPHKPLLGQLYITPSHAFTIDIGIGDGWIFLQLSTSTILLEVTPSLGLAPRSSFASNYKANLRALDEKLVVYQQDIQQLWTMNVSDLREPIVERRVGLLHDDSPVWIRDLTAFYATGETIRIADIRALEDDPDIISQLTMSFWINDTVLDGMHAYLLQGRYPQQPSLVHVVDLADPTEPVIRSEISASGDITTMVARDGYLYFTVYNQRTVFVYDCTDIQKPRLAWEISLPLDEEGELMIEDDYLLVKQGTVLHTYALDAPNAPSLVGTADLGVSLYLMRLDNGLLVGAEYGQKFHVFDFADAAHPVHLGLVEIGIQANTLAIHRGYVYAGQRYFERETNEAGFNGGIQIISIDQPDSPKLVGAIPIDVSSLDLRILDDRLWVGTRYIIEPESIFINGAVLIYDLTDPAIPVERMRLTPDWGWTDTYDTDGVHSVLSVEKDLYVVNWERGCSFCPVDLDLSGSINMFDVSAFIELFLINDPFADYTHDGIWNFFDISAFLQAFSAGCP